MGLNLRTCGALLGLARDVAVHGSARSLTEGFHYTRVHRPRSHNHHDTRWLDLERLPVLRWIVHPHHLHLVQWSCVYAFKSFKNVVGVGSRSVRCPAHSVH
eukprot:4464636-Amphidinium_carterae.2